MTNATPQPVPRRRVPRSRRAAGFTLIEAALATVIVGVGVLAIVSAQQAYHMKNDWSQRTGTALLLANEIRELMMPMPMHDPLVGADNLGVEEYELSVADFDDLDDFAGDVDDSGYGAGTTFNPPINALRQSVDDLDNWSQVVEVENVLPDYINSSVTQPLGTTDAIRVTVTIQYQVPGEEDPTNITSMTWVVMQ